MENSQKSSPTNYTIAYKAPNLAVKNCKSLKSSEFMKFKEIAMIILKKKRSIALRFLSNISKTDKWQPVIEESRKDISEFLDREIFGFVYYLTQYLKTADETFRSLYVGEKIKQLYDPNLSREQWQKQAINITSADKKVLLRYVKSKVSSDSLGTFERIIELINEAIISPNAKSLRILFIGDCLFLDILSFLIPECFLEEISIEPTYITSKIPAQVRSELLKHSSSNFDLVFFSPFSYEFSREYTRLLSWKNTILKEETYHGMIRNIEMETSGTLEVLVGHYDCPIFVHNASGIRRIEHKLFDRIKNFLSQGRKSMALRIINRNLTVFVAEQNKKTFEHLFILDENNFLKDFGENFLSEYIYNTSLQHPCRLGQVIAKLYQDIIYVNKYLQNKKLIICDLDNTLWKGIIGEGHVQPYRQRQVILNTLKKKGILLAVNSKNNYNNIRWEDAGFSEADFVSLQINWDPKIQNMKNIHQEVGIQYKDFIFLDDSAQEREFVKSAFKETLVLDPNDDRIWDLFRLWSIMLGENLNKDRTHYYKDEAKRKSIIPSINAIDENFTDSLKQLNLTVTVRQAQAGDIKRIVELINRTNQFNLNGTRTSFNEIKSWLGSVNFKLIVTEVADKFGAMGTVCCAAVEIKPESIEIPVFVLSCRVIGYKIETAVLNYIRKLIALQKEHEEKPIKGFYKKTEFNKPCSDMYENNGFILRDGVWFGSNNKTPDPIWLTIK